LWIDIATVMKIASTGTVNPASAMPPSRPISANETPTRTTPTTIPAAISTGVPSASPSSMSPNSDAETMIPPGGGDRRRMGRRTVTVP